MSNEDFTLDLEFKGGIDEMYISSSPDIDVVRIATAHNEPPFRRVCIDLDFEQARELASYINRLTSQRHYADYPES